MKKLPDEITIGEKYSPAMSITTQIEADQYFEVLVEHTMRFGHSRQEAESIEKQNLGYYAGYCDNDTRIRVENLFKCAHPIFGKAEQHKVTDEEAYELGRKFAEGK